MTGSLFLTPCITLLQVTELEAEFEKVKGEKVVPTRYLKSQQQKQAKMAAEAAAAGDAEGKSTRKLAVITFEKFADM